MQMKNPAWLSMPVLDVRALNAKQLKALAAAYDALADKELAPLAQLHIDHPVRRKIDEALSRRLACLTSHRSANPLACEPGLTAQEINPRQTQSALDLEDDDADDAQHKMRLRKKLK